MTELQKQIADTRRWLDALDAKADRGEVPEVADARVFRSNAEWLEKLVVRANIDAISARGERTPAEDRAAQVVVRRAGRYGVEDWSGSRSGDPALGERP